MFSTDNLELFSKWYSIMPNKISGKFKYIYISNVNSVHEFKQISNVFVNSSLILNNLLFDVLHIAKSTYMFDLIIYVDICELFSKPLLEDFKKNILNEKSEIWILCDNKKFNNENKISYVLNTIDTTSFRTSVIKFTDNFSLIVLK
jgi:hypothetical protein